MSADLPTPGDDARIYDQGYRSFTGELASPRSRFAVITRNELRLAWKGKWFRRLMWGSLVPLVVFAVLVVIQARFAGMIDEVIDVWMPFWGIQLFIAMLTVYHVGRRAVGEDLRTGALTLYFSRPISFVQYLLGKWLAIAVGVLAVTWIPGIVLSLFKWLAEPGADVLDFLAWVVSLTLLSGLACLTFGSVMLAVSSVTQRGRTAGIIWIVMFFVVGGLAGALVKATGYWQLSAVSFTQANAQLAEFLFSGRHSYLDALIFALGQVVWIVAGLSIVLLRLRRWMRV